MRYLGIDRQGRDELRVFRSFVDTARPDIAPYSIRKAVPPCPDVLCRSKEGHTIAFELTQVVDDVVARGINDQISLQSLLRKAYHNLPRSDQDQLKPILGNALVDVWFAPSASRRVRESAILAIISRLRQLTTTTETELPLTPDLQVNVKKLWVFRGDYEYEMPRFYVAAGSSFADPIVDRIREKFIKSYKSASPVELLAFYKWQDPSPPAFWRTELSDFVAGNLDASPFMRVWVYDVYQQEILFVYPSIERMQKP